MFLVHPKKDSPGTWEVAWTMLPFFLASDADLIREVDQKLTEWSQGKVLKTEETGTFTEKAHTLVLDTIMKKYPRKSRKSPRVIWSAITRSIA